jgi:hypothetical protein
MANEKRFNLYALGKLVGTFNVAELRAMIVSGRVLRISECSEVLSGSWPGDTTAKVPITSIPELADLNAQLIEDDPEIRAQARAEITNQLALYFGTWALVLLGIGLYLSKCVDTPWAVLFFIMAFPIGLTPLGYLFYPAHAIITFYCKKPRFAVMYGILILALALNVAGFLFFLSLFHW